MLDMKWAKRLFTFTNHKKSGCTTVNHEVQSTSYWIYKDVYIRKADDCTKWKNDQGESIVTYYIIGCNADILYSNRSIITGGIASDAEGSKLAAFLCSSIHT